MTLVSSESSWVPYNAHSSTAEPTSCTKSPLLYWSIFSYSTLFGEAMSFFSWRERLLVMVCRRKDWMRGQRERRGIAHLGVSKVSVVTRS